LGSKDNKKDFITNPDMPVLSHNNQLIQRTPFANKFFIDNPHPAYEQHKVSEYLLPKVKGTESDMFRGLPQGLPTSPILTVAALQTLFITKSKWDLLMYADDGLIYGCGPPPSEKEIKDTLSNPKYGIELNMEKSRFAKLPGEAINLKFLGMRLNGDTLSAETRNGSVLKYDKHDLVAIYDLLENWNATYSQDPKGREHSAHGRKPVNTEAELLDAKKMKDFFK
jgi:hypothetical protein